MKNCVSSLGLAISMPGTKLNEHQWAVSGSLMSAHNRRRVRRGEEDTKSVRAPIP